MRCLLQSLAAFATAASLFTPPLGAQNVVEVERPPLSAGYLEMVSAVEKLETTEPLAALRRCEETLPELRAPWERFDTVFWCLSFLYAETGRHDRCLRALQGGQKEGLFYPLTVGEHAFPPFIGELAGLDGFRAFFDENARLREAADRTAKTEYLVRTP
jgi:hypothetical protein